MFDNNFVKRRRWSDVVQTAKPIVYLPFTEDTFDEGFVTSGKQFLVATARKLVMALWRFVTDGTVPSGAVLKA